MDNNTQQPGFDPSNPYNQQYPTPQQPYNANAQWPPMKLSDWVVTNLLLLIPIANIVLIFMWAFGSNVNPSKKSYFQCTLIFMAIGIFLGIIVGIAAGGLMFAIMSNM